MMIHHIVFICLNSWDCVTCVQGAAVTSVSLQSFFFCTVLVQEVNSGTQTQQQRNEEFNLFFEALLENNPILLITLSHKIVLRSEL